MGNAALLIEQRLLYDRQEPVGQGIEARVIFLRLGVRDGDVVVIEQILEPDLAAIDRRLEQPSHLSGRLLHQRRHTRMQGQGFLAAAAEPEDGADLLEIRRQLIELACLFEHLVGAPAVTLGDRHDVVDQFGDLVVRCACTCAACAIRSIFAVVSSAPQLMSSSD
ncbi:hypothetical protein GWK36_14200 [Caldichromatium japonicum]|uniref:Uncharacterized protein n=1 Tax=Caldichromatium japonicum TaxID=2699430 RepID=A0A6G7VGB3_9GAMM|nr:hypothetical protein [Caldichromatium japonicum]QIK38950.1 hypothetical protein GWK36_14200 [Caldichromatium japonicum]